MKKILSFVIVLMAIGQVSANGIEPNSPVGISVIKKGALVKLFYRGEQSGKVKVTIYNDDGDVVYTETLYNRENFMRPYNFSSLPYGDYTIELWNKNGKSTQKVEHRSPDVKRVAHLTRLRNEKNKYVLSVPNEGKDALTVKILDENERIVYEETETVHGDFARVYNLNNISGAHIFVVKDKSGKVNRWDKPIR